MLTRWGKVCGGLPLAWLAVCLCSSPLCPSGWELWAGQWPSDRLSGQRQWQQAEAHQPPGPVQSPISVNSFNGTGHTRVLIYCLWLVLQRHWHLGSWHRCHDPWNLKYSPSGPWQVSPWGPTCAHSLLGIYTQAGYSLSGSTHHMGAPCCHLFNTVQVDNLAVLWNDYPE